MTVLIGCRTPTGAIIGSDSQLNWGDTKIHGSRKLFEVGRFIIGVSGPARLGTLITEARSRMERITTPTGIARVLKDLVSRDDWTVDQTCSGPRTADCALLLCNTRTGAVYWMDGSFSVEEVHPGRFIALGSGDEVATGAMAALEDLDPLPRVRRALEITCQHNAACGGDLDIREVSYE